MANQVSLMAYLQHGFQSIPVIDQGQSPRNTTNDRYSAADIASIGQWSAFNLASIQQRFGTMLEAARIQDEPVPPSPPRPVNSETAVQARLGALISNRIRRSLRCGFARLRSTQQISGLTEMEYDVGTMAKIIDNYVPDLAFGSIHLPAATRTNQAPGDIKPSYKWSLDMRNTPNPRIRTEFKQALSQVNFYMKQHHARYGFILTDTELVAIRRLDKNGNIQLSSSIPLTTSGTASRPKLTVLLGLWYLGMLAADNHGWYIE